MFCCWFVYNVIAKKNHKCNLKNCFALEAFACLIVVFWLLVDMFDNPFLDILGQQLVIVLIEWLFAGME